MFPFCCSKGLADNVVIAKVNLIGRFDYSAVNRYVKLGPLLQVDEVLWDLDRVLEGDCSLQLLKFEDEEGWSCRGPDELNTDCM